MGSIGSRPEDVSPAPAAAGNDGSSINCIIAPRRFARLAPVFPLTTGMRLPRPLAELSAAPPPPLWEPRFAVLVG